MAQKVTIQLVDDLDGSSEADETVVFGLDGTQYEIDLTDKNAAKLRKSLEAFVAAARRTGGAKARSGSRNGSKAASSGSSSGSGPKPADVRAWAKENGHDVPERGRIPAEVTEAYAAAN